MKPRKEKRAPTRRKASRLSLRIAWSKPERFEVPIPRDETRRLAVLRSYNILDTPPEETFDSVAVLASHVCGTPIALVVLIDRDRQWFKARVGVRIHETPREFAFCAYTIMQRRLFIIPDMTRDKRFAANPFVASGPKYRFYAGAPLVTPDNRALGTLCVIDKVPRKLSLAQETDLVALSRLVMRELEFRRELRRGNARNNGFVFNRDLSQKGDADVNQQQRTHGVIAELPRVGNVKGISATNRP